MHLRAIVATTHVDRHGERFAKEALEQAAEQFRQEDRPQWSYWNHLTTLPPIGITTKEEVELREDGEYQLTAEMRLLSDEDIEAMLQSNVQGVDVTPEELVGKFENFEPTPGYLEVSYDPRNFEGNDVEPIIQSLNGLIETRTQFRVRKAELPPAVIWILVAFAGGFVARLGELTADKALELYRHLSEQFNKLLEKAKPRDTVDVIFGIPIPGSNVVIEGAIENADAHAIEDIWSKLPGLYAIANHILRRNPQDFFSEMKFLYNPVSRVWEINYLTTRKTQRVILGPRYYTPSHPLQKRWHDELENYKRAVTRGDLGHSIGANPEE